MTWCANEGENGRFYARTLEIGGVLIYHSPTALNGGDESNAVSMLLTEHEWSLLLSLGRSSERPHL